MNKTIINKIINIKQYRLFDKKKKIYFKIVLSNYD